MTALILEPFLEGLGGAELLHTKELDVRPCRGCFTCWYRTPGRCVQEDDMRSVLEKVAAAETLAAVSRELVSLDECVRMGNE